LSCTAYQQNLKSSTDHFYSYLHDDGSFCTYDGAGIVTENETKDHEGSTFRISHCFPKDFKEDYGIFNVSEII